MWCDRQVRRRAVRLATVGAAALAAGALLVACTSDGDAGSAAIDDRPELEVLEVGDVVEATTEVDGSASVVSVADDVEATAAVYRADGARVAVDVEVCGDADAVAALWTLAIGDDALEPVPLPDGALSEENRPVFDFTAGPSPDGCRTGWVAWDVPSDGEGEGVVVWEGEPAAGWQLGER